MNKVVRKIIVWGLIVVVGLPNIVIGAPAYKVVGLAIVGGMIWWDFAASKKELSKKK
jgi:hypothetical protein